MDGWMDGYIAHLAARGLLALVLFHLLLEQLVCCIFTHCAGHDGWLSIGGRYRGVIEVCFVVCPVAIEGERPVIRIASVESDNSTKRVVGMLKREREQAETSQVGRGRQDNT